MRKKRGRWGMLLLATLVGLVLALYLGGLLGQLQTGYQAWLSQDGMTNAGATMPPVKPSPFYCIPYAFSAQGRSSTFLVLVAAAGIQVYIKVHDRFGGRDFDERNFTRSSKGTYGTAGWMTDKEIRSVLEVASPGNAKGIILGEKDGKVICLPEDTQLNKHIFVAGASGSMKSRAIARNYLFQSIKRGESVILTDPKSELYDDTSELFREAGYEVKVFNLVDPEHSDSWNCMAGMGGDTMTAQILTNVIIANTAKGKVDHFWDNGEGNLLKALILFVDQDASRPQESKHLPAVYQMLTQYSEKNLSSMFDRLPITHPARAPYNLFAQASDTVRAGIVLGLGTRLQILQNEAIRQVTSSSDIDLADPGRKKCAYYVILSDQENSTEFLSSLFFSFLFIKLTRYADSQPGHRCKVPVNILFEELAAVGQLDSYPRRLSVCRSRSVNVCNIVQGLAQFQNRYPFEQWAEIIGHCDTQLMLGCTEDQTAEFYSNRSGTMTVEVNSTMTVRQTIAIAQMIPQYRHTEGQGKRQLMTPDEILRLPHEELLIFLRGQKALRANKFDYTGHPYARKLRATTIFDYLPRDSVVRSPVSSDSSAKPPTRQVSKPLAPDATPAAVTTEPNRPSGEKKARLMSDFSPPKDF